MEKNISKNEMIDLDKPLSNWLLLLLPFYITAIMLVFLLPFAGEWWWLEAWLFAVVLAVHMTIWMLIINKENPRVLRNRMKTKKEGLSASTKKSASSDRWVIPLMSLGFFGAMVLPAFNQRFGWSTMPFLLEIVGLIVMNIGVGIINLSTLQNAYASKILDINQGQRLIDTGLYSQVRHPLYSGGILMALGTPVALGHWPSLILAAVAALTLVARIPFEEDMLLKGMDGYAEYRERVPYKLIPGIY
ncbi:MAG TPA: isoprenylcysteine carboxylmethyltransferase family protein [Anaerolineales bacterium]|nr:isoprenylcysteine carboxylmethyltransferase family protein [Anaerolineales bacterium]